MKERTLRGDWSQSRRHELSYLLGFAHYISRLYKYIHIKLTLTWLIVLVGRVAWLIYTYCVHLMQMLTSKTHNLWWLSIDCVWLVRDVLIALHDLLDFNLLIVEFTFPYTIHIYLYIWSRMGVVLNMCLFAYTYIVWRLYCVPSPRMG